MIAVRVNDRATPALRQLLQQVRGPAGLKVAARGVANVARDHFDVLDQTQPNKMGGRRTHFWRGVRRSVQAPLVRGSVGIIGINHVGIRQRLDGGVIRPVNRKYLTIPARAEAYGRTAREFHNLSVAYGRGGAYALVENQVTRLRRTKSGKLADGGTTGGLVMFWLVRRVVQRPFGGALPSDQAMANGAVSALQAFLAAKAAQQGVAP